MARSRFSRPPRGVAHWWLADKVLRRAGAAIAFSQEGEDRLLERFLEARTPGIYVDVGAHDPVRFSNTMGLYLRGWRGLSIEPRPGAEARFRALRPRDVFINAGIGTSQAPLDYFEFDEPALNTFDAKVAEALVRGTRYRLVRQSSVQLRALADVLRESLPMGRFDLLNVDVEGMDLDVLRSNDWTVYRPEFVCCEARDPNSRQTVVRYLRSHGYTLVGSTMNSLIHRRQDQPM